MKAQIDSDHLAMILAASTEVANPPESREDIVGIWLGKTVPQQYAYRLRARRLLKAWNGIKRLEAPTVEIA